MFKKIREYWLDRAFKKNVRKRDFLNLNKMQNIFIIFDYDDLMEIILLGNNLEKMGKKTYLWTAVDDECKLENLIFSKKIRVIKPQDLSPLFIIKKKIADEFSSLEYDTFIDVRGENSPESLEYLLATNKSISCIGFRSHIKKAFDFCILRQKGKSILETYEQMKYYLLKINN